HRASWMGASLVLSRTLDMIIRRPVPPDSHVQHREIWTILPGDVLNIDVTDSPWGAVPVTTHLSYNRVPVPETIAPGQNLLENPEASAAGAGWTAQGDAKVEQCESNN